MNKITGIIIGIIVLCFGGLIIWSVNSTSSEKTNYKDFDAAKVIESNEANGGIGDHVRGKADSPVVFVEYGDFQCAGCATTHPKVDALFKQYGDRVAFVFRNFPINGHQNARAAAAAAESAGMQGYFSEMVSAVYANQATWSYAAGSARTEVFADLFEQIAPDGDVEKFKTDMGNENITKKINFDYNIGLEGSGVTGTPSFYVNGESVDLSGSATATDFYTITQELLDKQLSENGLPTGPVEETDETE